jgi:hypothetical protein
MAKGVNQPLAERQERLVWVLERHARWSDYFTLFDPDQ